MDLLVPKNGVEEISDNCVEIAASALEIELKRHIADFIEIIVETHLITQISVAMAVPDTGEELDSMPVVPGPFLGVLETIICFLK